MATGLRSARDIGSDGSTRRLDEAGLRGVDLSKQASPGAVLRLRGARQLERPALHLEHAWRDVGFEGASELLTPYLLFVDNQDQPGSIGAVGMIAGRHNINISFMEVGRLALRGRAMMVIGLDDPVPPDVMEEFKNLEQINNVRLAHLGSL